MEREEATIQRALDSSLSTGGADGGAGRRGGRASGECGAAGGDRSVGERIARELHDTVKQNLCGAAMMIEACFEAQARDEDPALVGKLLRRALDMTREAEHQLSRPLEDLARSSPCGAAPTAFLKERFERLGTDFGMITHASLKAPLEVLPRGRIVVAHRVCMETSWNAVKHSGAENLWLESRLAGGAFVLAVRDDGCGFRLGEATGGLGLFLMRFRKRTSEDESTLRLEPEAA